MTKIVFDADALIKLVKAGITADILATVSVYISEDVYSEVVIEGKKQFFEDAYRAEQFVAEKVISPVPTKNSDPFPGLGKGETSSYFLLLELNAAAIVSDDAHFLKFLEKRGISFVTPASFVVALVKARKIEKEQGRKILENLKQHIDTTQFERYMRELEE